MIPLHADSGCASVPSAGLCGSNYLQTAETRFTVAGISLESGMNRQSSKLTACKLNRRENHGRVQTKYRLLWACNQPGRSVRQGPPKAAATGLNEADTGNTAELGRYSNPDELAKANSVRVTTDRAGAS